MVLGAQASTHVGSEQPLKIQMTRCVKCTARESLTTKPTEKITFGPHCTLYSPMVITSM